MKAVGAGRLLASALVILGVLLSGSNAIAFSDPPIPAPVVNPPNPQTAVEISLASYMGPGVSVYSAFAQAVNAARTQRAARLVIPPGQYVFDDPLAQQNGYHLLLNNLSDLTIEGVGAALVFRYAATGVLLVESDRVLIRGVSIDYDLPIASPGVVRKESNGTTVIEVPPAYPVTAGTPIAVVSKFDATALTWTKSSTEVYNPQSVTLPRSQTLSSPDFAAFSGGDAVILRHHNYTASAFYLAPGTSDITFEDVTVYTAPGMAFTIWGADRGFRFSRVTVARKAVTGRLISTAADAVHISHTLGDIIVEDCDFSGQGDDSLNIHGLWLTLTQKVNATTVILTRSTHGLVGVGEQVAFVRADSLAELARLTVSQVQFNNSDRYTVTFAEPVPSTVVIGNLATSVTRSNPRFVVRRNSFHDHRARGMLIQAPNGLIENNTVRDTTMNGLHLTTDATFFEESNSVSHVTVRNNTFVRCGYGSPELGSSGRHMGCISVLADVASGLSPHPVHSGILIEGNRILDAAGLAILVASSDDVTVRDNLIVRPNQFSFVSLQTGQGIDATAHGSIMVTRSSHVTLTGNRLIQTADMFDHGIYVDARNTSNVALSGNTEAADAAAPMLAVTTPTTGPDYSTSSPLLTLAGTASDDVLLTGVSWSNDRGGGGTAAGTESWSVPGITLSPGLNVLTASAVDAVGKVVTRTLRVAYGDTGTVIATPATLQFGAADSGATLQTVTPAQTVVVTFSAAAMAWTAVSNQPWLTITGGSATSAGAFTAQVVKSLVPSGATALSATITITAAGASNNPLIVPVVLTVTTTAVSTAPFGAFDTPVAGAAVAGSIPVTGWAVDDTGVERVEIWRDRVAGETTPLYPGPGPGTGKIYIADAVFVTGARPDIEASPSYSTYPLANRAGWGYLMLTRGLWNQGNGPFTLYAFAYDLEGKSSVLGSKAITVSNATAVKPFGSIDVPAYGQTMTTSFYNFGWALTPTATPECSVSTVRVSIDSGPLQPVNYGDARADIAAAFPGFSNGAGAGGAYYIDISTLANGSHQIGWYVVDSCNRAEGIGSRFFSVLVGSSTVPLESRPTLTAADAVREVSDQPVMVRRELEAVPIEATADGDHLVTLRQEERIEVELPATGGAPYVGYQIVNGTRRGLPAGSSLDSETGVFYWQPATGFMGPFDLEFVAATGGVVRVQVVVASPQ